MFLHPLFYLFMPTGAHGTLLIIISVYVHPTLNLCKVNILSWFTQYHLNSFTSCSKQNSKLLLEIKKASKSHILNIKANGNNYHHCLLSSMIQHRSYTPQNEDTFLALKSEKTHLLPCLSVSFPKNISTSFTSSPLTSPWVWEQVSISSTTSSSCSDNYPSTSFILYFWQWRYTLTQAYLKTSFTFSPFPSPQVFE